MKTENLNNNNEEIVHKKKEIVLFEICSKRRKEISMKEITKAEYDSFVMKKVFKN